jgi:hypothetical protein
VVCFGFTASSKNTDVAVSELVKKVMRDTYGFDSTKIFGAAISDRAAKGIASQLDLEEEVCAMHDGDKLGQAAIGDLTRSRGGRVVKPFAEGVALMTRARKLKMGTYFSYGTRHSELIEIGQKNEPQRVPGIKVQIDLNGTRVAAKHGLVFSLLRLSRALKVYAITKEAEIKSVWSFSNEDWETLAEFEAVLNVTKMTTSMAQYEKLYTGA